MNKKNEPEFTVTDRRRFTSEGDAAPEQRSEPEQPKAEKTAPQPRTPESPAVPVTPQSETRAERDYQPPTQQERKAQEDAFNASTQKLDAELKTALGPDRSQDLQMTFERFVASIYMTALLQLGLMREQGGAPPPVDLVGARQTIDTLGLLSDKTKGNLNMQEDNLLQNCLYELRMAYVEVTNAITHAPQPGAGGPVPGR